VQNDNDSDEAAGDWEDESDDDEEMSQTKAGPVKT